MVEKVNLTQTAQADTRSVTASMSGGTDKVSKMTREHWQKMILLPKEKKKKKCMTKLLN